jgi:hypothetical protein
VWSWWPSPVSVRSRTGKTAVRAGFDPHLTKPADPRELAKLLSELRVDRDVNRPRRDPCPSAVSARSRFLRYGSDALDLTRRARQSVSTCL